MPEAATGTRLQVVLARAGVASRRASEALIREGEVKVNGRVVTELGTRVEEGDHVTVHGKALRSPQAHCYVLLNKPREVVTTARDPEGRRTVLDFVPALKARVWPVGRLDYHSEGLVILTNDGELTQALTHPSRHVPRVYHAKIDGSLGPEARAQLRKGVRLQGHLTGPIEARPLRDATHSEDHAWIEVIVHEGRYHLVREALARVGHPVSRLKRVAFGPLKLGRTPAGAARDLLASEVEALKKACRAGKPPLPAPARARPASRQLSASSSRPTRTRPPGKPPAPKRAPRSRSGQEVAPAGGGSVARRTAPARRRPGQRPAPAPPTAPSRKRPPAPSGRESPEAPRGPGGRRAGSAPKAPPKPGSGPSKRRGRHPQSAR